MEADYRGFIHVRRPETEGLVHVSMPPGDSMTEGSGVFLARGKKGGGSPFHAIVGLFTPALLRGLGLVEWSSDRGANKLLNPRRYVQDFLNCIY